MHTIELPLHVLPEDVADGLLFHLVQLPEILGASFDQELTLRVLCRSSFKEEDLARAIIDAVSALTA